MINYKSAKNKLIKSNIKINDEKINSSYSLNRVTTFDIYSSVDYPAGNNAAFDGYAINSKDTFYLNKKNFKKFKILKTVAAGDNPKIKNVKKFECIEVMTGAIIPKPFNTIIPIEQIQFFLNNRIKKFILVNKKIKKNNYIRFLGSDYKKNELIIAKGTLIQPSHILAFKSLGIEKVIVKKKPNIIFLKASERCSKQSLRSPIFHIHRMDHPLLSLVIYDWKQTFFPAIEKLVGGILNFKIVFQCVNAFGQAFMDPYAT